MEPKDYSWKDSIASIVLQVIQGDFSSSKRLFRVLQAFHERKVPPNLLPLAPELKQRKKTAARPEKSVAVSRHQSRLQLS